MTSEITTAICVWHDHFCSSDPDEHAWIVSLERLDEQMHAATTKTLDVIDDYDDAVEAAREEGRKRGLPVYHNDGDGVTLLQEA